jgi:hypothetical protein
LRRRGGVVNMIKDNHSMSEITKEYDMTHKVPKKNDSILLGITSKESELLLFDVVSNNSLNLVPDFDLKDESNKATWCPIIVILSGRSSLYPSPEKIKDYVNTTIDNMALFITKGVEESIWQLYNVNIVPFDRGRKDFLPIVLDFERAHFASTLKEKHRVMVDELSVEAPNAYYKKDEIKIEGTEEEILNHG